jgi:hypothetical protein
MLSECKGDFEDAEMPHKIDDLIHAVELPTYIYAISDSTGDSKAPPTPHPPNFSYENTDFTTILGNISIITYFKYFKI